MVDFRKGIKGERKLKAKTGQDRARALTCPAREPESPCGKNSQQGNCLTAFLAGEFLPNSCISDGVKIIKIAALAIVFAVKQSHDCLDG